MTSGAGLAYRGEMGKFVSVHHDTAREFVHIRYLSGVLQSEAQVAEFAREIDQAIVAAVGRRKVDIIVDLGDLTVKPVVAHAYDTVRLRLREERARRAYRYGGTAVVRTKVLTSSTIHGERANVHETFEQALAALLADRSRDAG